MAQDTVSPQSNSHYILNLTLNEFSILNVSEMDGLLKYGGSGDFKLNMAKEGSNVVWNVTVDNPRLMELLSIFVGEKTMKLIQSLDPNNLNPNQKIALEAIKSLSQKLDYARDNPTWDAVKISGIILTSPTNCILQNGDDTLQLLGGKLQELKMRSGKPVVAEGYIKIPGKFEVTHFIDQKQMSLELFVMSHCPFGQKAESRLLAFLDSTNAHTKPSIEIHYIFYKQQKGGKDTFFSLHGEDEIVEDLVQIAIRDQYSQLFQLYLRRRAINNSAPWRQLAEELGLKPVDEAMIENLITTQRDAMIQKEYDYAQQYGISDGSPSYVWESQKVTGLNKIEEFRGLDSFKDEGCSQ